MSEIDVLKAQVKNEEDRRKLLAKHYHNALLHGVKLKDALERVLKECKSPDHSDASVMIMKIEALVEDALKLPHPEAIMSKRQSERLRAQYGDNMFHGHPFEEYLFLPMRPTDDYVDPFES